MCTLIATGGRPLIVDESMRRADRECSPVTNKLTRHSLAAYCATGDTGGVTVELRDEKQLCDQVTNCSTNRAPDERKTMKKWRE